MKPKSLLFLIAIFVTIIMFIIKSLSDNAKKVALKKASADYEVFLEKKAFTKDSIEKIENERLVRIRIFKEDSTNKIQNQEINAIRQSAGFLQFVEKAKKGELSFKKWFKHQWFEYGEFSKKDEYERWGRWQTTETYPKTWYGGIWHNMCFYDMLHKTPLLDEKYFSVLVKFNRDADFLKNLFDTYEQSIYQTVTKEIYLKNNLKDCFEVLLKSYQVLTKDPNTLDNISKMNDDERYKYFFDLVYPNYKKEDEDRIDFDVATKSGSKMWIYSFWYRRYKEKNMYVVHDIISRMYKHYQ